MLRVSSADRPLRAHRAPTATQHSEVRRGAPLSRPKCAGARPSGPVVHLPKRSNSFESAALVCRHSVECPSHASRLVWSTLQSVMLRPTKVRPSAKRTAAASSATEEPPPSMAIAPAEADAITAAAVGSGPSEPDATQPLEGSGDAEVAEGQCCAGCAASAAAGAT